MSTTISPMSANTLVLCLAGELLADPAEIVEVIKSEADLLSLVRQYGKGEATYQEVLEALNALI